MWVCFTWGLRLFCNFYERDVILAYLNQLVYSYKEHRFRDKEAVLLLYDEVGYEEGNCVFTSLRELAITI